ncbi:hypothetical protein ALP99_00838 [Pseudomonas syringae pv. tomato]|uniref:Uncharacterized protein n=4 Tax=Pseudomonas syringae group TaxID=136849 RepID=A0A0Q0AK20_PSESX|nr:Uncharacterized protein AC505_3980 [Pseudomonas syringae pv. maculicola]KPC15882.1 Uncharacterized protein AC506_0400 [Pseudomonas syringae pv. maculicola str. M6]KPW50265.1 Uncharacterized protein ALO88_02979 [Pseudomonas syringae pv. antirrhini]KPW60944.1 Uncharacterized protein ALO86_03975 [Pseudomonas syringae pv. berberidis]KPY63318.1 Uncharacterized protein ALO94_04487 [Pseudomonas syringae pv. spinaceae]RML40498.1 hypothetical protein ALQ95_100249 [Pseudomonas syringae pv. ribicola]
MMKAYWIAHVDVTDPQQYSEYTQRAPAAFQLFGGKFLARGGRSEAIEGRATPQRTVIIEFESYEQAVACYHSPQYQNAMSHRQGAAKAEIVIVEGQP